MEKAEKSDAALRKQVADLTAEVERKKRLAMQAIAARGQFKETLSEYQHRVSQFEGLMSKKDSEVREALAERDRYEKKHDEMFQAVSGLNGRIEELEQHKLHLLQKLKKTGDKGDLSYIIKTQKLENVKGKEFDGKVTVEDYNPEELRKQRDAEFAAQKAAQDAAAGDTRQGEDEEAQPI